MLRMALSAVLECMNFEELFSSPKLRILCPLRNEFSEIRYHPELMFSEEFVIVLFCIIHFLSRIFKSLST